MIYRPENVLLIGFITYLIVYLLSPLEITVPIEYGSLIFIATTSIALVFGSRFADMISPRKNLRKITVLRLERIEGRLFWGTLLLGLTGSLLRLYDQLILRGSSGLTGLDAREALIDQTATQFSLLGGVLYPFGFLPIFILLGARALPRTKLRLGFACAVFLIPAVAALALYSRSFMLVSLAMIYFGVSLAVFRGRALPRQLLLPAVLGISTILTISASIFAWRLNQMSLTILHSVLMSGYSYTATPTNAALEVIRGGGWLGVTVAGVLPILQYYVHGPLEFQILWSDYDTQVFSHGALLFSPYVKLLSIFGIASQPDLYELFPRVGVFTSFWGPLWVDFGWLSLLVMFLFGFVARRIAIAARAADLGAVPLYTYICVILFFMPVVNFAISAQGMYVINAFVIFWFMSRGIARAALV